MEFKVAYGDSRRFIEDVRDGLEEANSDTKNTLLKDLYLCFVEAIDEDDQDRVAKLKRMQIISL